MTTVQLLLLVATIIATGVGVELWRRRDERRTVERAIYDELIGLRAEAGDTASEIARRYEAGEPFDAGFFLAWRLSTPLVYPAIADKLGRLSWDARERVTFFHAQLANAREKWAEARLAGAFEPSPYRILNHLGRAYWGPEPWMTSIRRELPIHLRDIGDMPAVGRLLESLEQSAIEGAEPVVGVYWPH